MPDSHMRNNGGGSPMLGGRSLQDFVPLSSEEIDHYREQVQDMDRRARTFIRENPTTVVVAAVAIGFVLGRLLSR